MAAAMTGKLYPEYTKHLLSATAACCAFGFWRVWWLHYRSVLNMIMSSLATRRAHLENQAMPQPRV
jgi:hypothetical protein